MHLAVQVDRDDRHPGREGPHRFSKFRRIQSHVVETLLAPPAETQPATSPNRSAPQPPTLPRPAVVSFDATVPLTAITPAAPRSRSASTRALAELRPGIAISREAALSLIGCADEVLPELLATARAAKERFKPGLITYSRKVF